MRTQKGDSDCPLNEPSLAEYVIANGSAAPNRTREHRHACTALSSQLVQDPQQDVGVASVYPLPRSAMSGMNPAASSAVAYPMTACAATPAAGPHDGDS